MEKAFQQEWYKNDNNENLSFKIKENTIKKLINDNNINDKDLSIILKESISDYKKDLNDVKKENKCPLYLNHIIMNLVHVNKKKYH